MKTIVATPMHRLSAWSLAALLCLSPMFAADPLALFGSLSIEAYSGIGDSDLGDNGFESELRMILEAKPEDDISFRAEGGYKSCYGIASVRALAFDAGLEPIPSEDDLPPGTDLHRDLFIDQAYASASLDRIALRAGIIPVGWGTGYLYNPTARTSQSEFPGENMDVTVGKPGMALVLALPAGFSAEGYLLAAARNESRVPEVSAIDAGRLPFGTKLQYRSDTVDLSVSFIRQRLNDAEDVQDWLGADAAGFIGDVNWYAEGAFAKRETEVCAGFSYAIPGISTTVRTEFIGLSGGNSDNEKYDTGALLTGDRILLATRYLYLGLEKEDTEAGRWKVSAGTLVNLDDHSAILSAETNWSPRQSVELSAFARYFRGADSDEFGGERPVAPGVAFRPYRSLVGIGAKWTF